MKIRTIVMVAALGLAGFAMPAVADGNRGHGNWSGHRGGHYSHYYRPYGHVHARGYYGYYGGPYVYAYAPYLYAPYPYVYAPAYAPYPRYYHAPHRHGGTHVSVALGFGF
jgi:hypothetical protein